MPVIEYRFAKRVGQIYTIGLGVALVHSMFSEYHNDALWMAWYSGFKFNDQREYQKQYYYSNN